MNDIAPDRLVREIALAIPGALRVFEKHRVDFCCGGGRTLSEGCVRAGVELDAVLADLVAEARACESREQQPPVAQLSLEELVTLVVDRHHTYVWREEERLPALAQKVARVHGATYPFLIEVEGVVGTLFTELREHQLREERVLFPHFVALSRAAAHGGPIPSAAFGSVETPTRAMVLQHDEMGALLEKLHALTNRYDPPTAACGSWRGLFLGLQELERDLMRHVHLENDVVFPLACALEAKLTGERTV